MSTTTAAMRISGMSSMDVALPLTALRRLERIERPTLRAVDVADGDQIEGSAESDDGGALATDVGHRRRDRIKRKPIQHALSEPGQLVVAANRDLDCVHAVPAVIPERPVRPVSPPVMPHYRHSA
jgi:hypothetical protein